jgi:hypothetical protein
VLVELDSWIHVRLHPGVLVAALTLLPEAPG